MNKMRLIMLTLCAFAAHLTANIKLKPGSNNLRPRKPDISASLDNARKSLAHFAELTENRELAQTLSDISKTLKTAKKKPTSLTKEDVEHTFAVIEEITHKIDNAHDEAALSKNCGCQEDCCKELKKLLCKIRGIIERCCKHLTKEIKEIKKLINTKFPCAHSIKIDHVPFVITKPGKYCVTKDLIFTGPGAAITVAVSNVTINFANHSLTLIDPAAVGISASGISELVIENDVIQCSTESSNPLSVAIRLENTKKVTIDGVFTLNTYYGILAITSDDTTVINSHFEHHRGGNQDVPPTDVSAAIRAQSCTNFVVDNCVFTDNVNTTTGGFNNFGISFENVVGTSNPSLNCKVTNSEFLNSNLGVRFASGVMVHDCSFTTTEPSVNTTLLKLGNGTLAGVLRIARDVIISNCTFTNLAASGNANGFDGIIAVAAQGVLIDNVIIDSISPVDSVTPYAPAALHIGSADQGGDPTAIVSNLTIRNSIIQNTPFRGIYSESGNSGIVVDNCLITGAIGANIFFDDTTASTIKNSEISLSLGHGIRLHTLTSGSNNNAILSNVLNDNGLDGIRVETGSTDNLIKNNDAFVNGHIGLDNVDLTDFTNQFYINDACNNLGGDCVGINPPTLVGPPGCSPVTNGLNICCNSTSTVCL